MEHRGFLAPEGGKTEALEEVDLTSDRENLLDSSVLGPLAAELDQTGGDAAVLEIGVDGQGADFGDPLRIDLESAAADDLASVGGDKEGCDAGEVALDQLVGEEADQGSDGGHILGDRGAYRKRHWE